MVQVNDLVTKPNLCLFPVSITHFTSVFTVTTFKILLALTVMQDLHWQNMSITSSEFVISVPTKVAKALLASTKISLAVLTVMALLLLCAEHV